jgi:hypothetical protein
LVQWRFSVESRPCAGLKAPSRESADVLEAAVDQAVAACGGDMQSTIRVLIVANEFLIRSE